MKMRKLVAIAMTLALGISLLAGCSNGSGSGANSSAGGGSSSPSGSNSGEPVAASELLAGKKVIYACNNVNDDWGIITTEYLKTLVEGAGGECTIYNAQGDAATQAQMVDDAIIAKPDMLVVKPVDQAALVPALQRANQANIPIITIDMGIVEDADVDILCAVQTRQESLGSINAQFVVDKAKETGVKAKIVTVLGDMSSDVAVKRQTGFNEVIEANPDYAEVLAETEAKWDASQAYTAVKDMMTAHPDANTVFCSADGMGIGAVQALTDMGYTAKVGEEGHITFVCIDCDPNGCKNVAAGIIDQEAEHNAALHSDIAFKVIVDYLHGYEVPEAVLFETTTRNADNISEAWGNMDVKNVANWGWTDQDIYVLQTPYTE